MELTSKYAPLFGNPWTMEGIKKHPLSPRIYSQACIPILVLSEAPPLPAKPYEQYMLATLIKLINVD